jgi:hypothetical protein
MKSMQGPFVSVAINKQNAANIQAPLVGVVSGEFTTSSPGVPLGAMNGGGRMSNVWLSIATSGKDDAQTLGVEVDVKINGSTCLATKPKILHVSGEASQQKTTKITGDTGITQAVMNASANTYTAGDVITWDRTVTRTASPTTEMANLVVVVEFEPII